LQISDLFSQSRRVERFKAAGASPRDARAAHRTHLELHVWVRREPPAARNGANPDVVVAGIDAIVAVVVKIGKLHVACRAPLPAPAAHEEQPGNGDGGHKGHERQEPQHRGAGATRLPLVAVGLGSTLEVKRALLSLGGIRR
jgi:hypothetical protein